MRNGVGPAAGRPRVALCVLSRLNNQTIALSLVEQFAAVLFSRNMDSQIKHAPSLVTESHRACEPAHSQPVRLATPA